MSVDTATPDDIVSWLEIVREVEPLFGPMPDFRAALAQKISEGDALCVRASEGAVAGAMLLGGTAEHGWIRWLAVRRAARGQGIGRRLVEAAVARLPAAHTISLDTFREDEPDGCPARRLYQRMGFIAGPLVEANGALRQRYVLTRR
jgi:ribosomal protein S18 acetylase RimI-like enzyme